MVQNPLVNIFRTSLLKYKFLQTSVEKAHSIKSIARALEQIPAPVFQTVPNSSTTDMFTFIAMKYSYLLSQLFK